MTHRPSTRARSTVAVFLAGVLAAAAQLVGSPAAHAESALLTQQRTLVVLGYLRGPQATGKSSTPARGAIANFQVDRCLDRTATVTTSTNAQLKGVAKLVQRKLGRTADGTLDYRDAAAVRSWQVAHKLPATGQADAATMKAMGISRTRGCGNPVRGDLTKPSTAFGCAPGTRHLGVHEGYLNGRRVSVRLCAVTGLKSSSAESQPGSAWYVKGANGDVIVISQASGAYAGLVQVAKNTGLRLTANSSYRTMGHQKQLCADNARCRAGDYTFVLKPGWSNHQLGAAVDFAGSSATGSCSRPARQPSSRSWSFLNRNASRYRVHQYEPEAWHWEAAPSTCG